VIRVPIQIRYNDYDDRGHVNNAVYLTYFELARNAAWSAVTGEADGEPGFILARAIVNYRSPAVPGTALAVEVTAGEVRSKSWSWRYRVVDEADGRLIADGETTQVLYDYPSRSTVVIGEGMKARLGGI
jgi:acyl-CoA thioester hydrolase